MQTNKINKYIYEINTYKINTNIYRIQAYDSITL